MGGDHGPEVVIAGAALSLVRQPTLKFVLCGDEARIQPVLAREPDLAKVSRIVHTATAVSMTDKPSQAVRRGKGTSMWLALEAVQKGEADVAVSAGNTGALMAMAKLVLRPMTSIEPSIRTYPRRSLMRFTLRRKVLFPQPDGPISDVIIPFLIFRLTLNSA